MDRDDFGEDAPGEIVPTTAETGNFAAFRPDPLPPEIGAEALITPLADATQALGLVVVLGLVILVDNPPLTISELVLFELEVLILWIGILVVALFIDYRRKEE